MFERLASIVENLPVPTSPADVAELAAILREGQRLYDLGVAAVAQSGEWAADGDVSVSAWLRRECDASGAQASRQATLARRLNLLPGVSAAYESGSLSPAQVECITTVLTGDVLALFAEREALLLPVLAPLGIPELTSAMQHFVEVARDELGKAPEEPRRSLHLSKTLGGRRELRGSFDPEGGETIAAALRLVSTYQKGDTRPPSERLADALVEGCRQLLAASEKPVKNRNRPRIEIVIDIDDLDHGRLRDGTPLDRTTTRRLLCDSQIARVIKDGPGIILDYGRDTRVVPTPLRNAVISRDQHCRAGVCDRPAEWSEVHHILPWEDGGPTEIDNLVLLCVRHHHLLHRPGHEGKLLPDGTFVLTTPNGKTIESRPPP